MQCQGISVIWRAVTTILQTIIPDIEITKSLLHFGLMSDDRKINTVINTVVSITLWQIWKRRCKKRYDDILLPMEACLGIIKIEILEHLHILAKKKEFENCWQIRDLQTILA